jgi:aryl carrier-like protein
MATPGVFTTLTASDAVTFSVGASSGSGKQSRSSLYGNLIHASEAAPDSMYSHKLIEQIGCLISKDNIIDHPAGGHDDMVIAWLLVHWFIYNAKNLSLYGIDSLRLMTLVEKIDKVAMSAREERELAHQLRIRREIDLLNEMAAEESDEFIIERYENRLRVLSSQLVLEEGEFFSLDSLLADLKKKRKYKSHTNQRR